MHCLRDIHIEAHVNLPSMFFHDEFASLLEGHSITSKAELVFQLVLEKFMSGVFVDFFLACRHAKRTIILPSDIKLVALVKGLAPLLHMKPNIVENYQVLYQYESKTAKKSRSRYSQYTDTKIGISATSEVNKFTNANGFLIPRYTFRKHVTYQLSKFTYNVR